jgi:hypothetical protein
MDFVFILIKNENINRHDWMDKYDEHWTRLDGQIRTLDTIGHDWTRLKMIVSIVI